MDGDVPRDLPPPFCDHPATYCLKRSMHYQTLCTHNFGTWSAMSGWPDGFGLLSCSFCGRPFSTVEEYEMPGRVPAKS